jgi:hypothetical protein
VKIKILDLWIPDVCENKLISVILFGWTLLCWFIISWLEY